MTTPYFRFTTIAHSDHTFFSPLSSARAEALIRLFDLPARGHILDIGCGRAELLLRTLSAYPAVRGLGVDPNTEFISRARRAAVQHGVEERATWEPTELCLLDLTSRYDLALCIGASQAFGTADEALAGIGRLLKPGGLLLFGDGFWKQPPAPEYLAVLGATAEEMGSHADNAARAEAAGYDVLYTACANEDEWDEYEGLYCRAVQRFVKKFPEDPDAPAFAERITRWHHGYLRWGRQTLGFGYYLLRWRGEVPEY